MLNDSDEVLRPLAKMAEAAQQKMQAGRAAAGMGKLPDDVFMPFFKAWQSSPPGAELCMPQDAAQTACPFCKAVVTATRTA